MSKKKYREVYNTTSDRRTFKIIHIGSETGCCLRCAKRAKNKFYGNFINSRRQTSFPNWKLTSKCKKQWQRKKLKKQFWKNERGFDFAW